MDTLAMHIHHHVLRWIHAPMKRRYDRYYHPRNRHWRKHLVADVLMVVVVVVMVIAVLLIWWAPVLPEAVLIDISAQPLELVNGEHAHINIDIANQSKERLANVTAVVLIPSTVEQALFAPQELYTKATKTFTIGNLTIGARAHVEVDGVWWASVDNPSPIRVLVSYDDARGHTSMIERERVLVTAPTHHHLAIQGPNTIMQGEPFDIHILLPASPRTLQLAFEHDPSVEMLASSLKSVSDTPVWSITPSAHLVPLTIKLRMSDALHHDLAFTLSADINHQEIVIDRESLPVDGAALPLSIETSVQGGEHPVSLGDALTVTVTLRNISAEDSTDLQVTTQMDGLFADTLNKKTWDQESFPQLERLRPGDHIELSAAFRLPAHMDVSMLKSAEEARVLIRSSVRARLARSIEPVTIDASDLFIPLNSQLALSAKALYFSIQGEQLGRGPLPPEVGERTRLWALVAVTNTVHDMRDAVVHAHLTPGVEWGDKVSVSLGDPARYDVSTRTMTWSIGSIETFIGKAPPEILLAFEVGITPAAHDRGRAIKLVDSFTIDGVDTVTGASMTASAPSLTTASLPDQTGIVK